MKPEDFTTQMATARSSVTTKRLPTMLEELGEWMEDVDYRRQFAFDSGQPLQLFFDGIHTSPDNRRYAAFRRATVLNAAVGGIITIEMYATFSIVPKRLESYTKKWDNCYQLLMVPEPEPKLSDRLFPPRLCIERHYGYSHSATGGL